MNVDYIFEKAYSQRVVFNPVPKDVFCNHCKTRLKVYYAEDRLYAVKCGYCESITLVRADNPIEAALHVGEAMAHDSSTT